MKILLLTNLKNEEAKEDKWIADILKKDKNIVDISWIDYDECLDNEYDIFIKRNIWLSDDHNYGEILKYEDHIYKQAPVLRIMSAAPALEGITFSLMRQLLSEPQYLRRYFIALLFRYAQIDRIRAGYHRDTYDPNNYAQCKHIGTPDHSTAHAYTEQQRAYHAYSDRYSRTRL